MLFSKYSTRLSYINVSPFHLGPATTLASLLLARAILQIFEATLYEFLDPWILLFLFKMAEPRRPIEETVLAIHRVARLILISWAGPPNSYEKYGRSSTKQTPCGC